LTAAIDIGNTRTKLALFDGDNLVEHYVFESDEMGDVIGILLQHKTDLEGCIVASTKKLTTSFKKAFLSLPNAHVLSSKTKLPITLAYKTKTTLGADRMAACCGGQNLHKQTDLLIITAGTCITYNMLEKNGQFIGGAIAPGLHMRYNALNTFTDKLPLVKNIDFDELIGQSTNESILSGVRQGIIAEVEGIISAYRNIYPAIKVLITGGDAAFFESKLKNEIFAHPFLILQGLNSILKYNSEI